MGEPHLPHYRSLDERSLLVEWPGGIDRAILRKILQLETALTENPVEGITEWFHTYQTLAIQFNEEVITAEALKKALTSLQKKDLEPGRNYRWKLPVCYDLSFGYDLKALSKAKNLEPDEVIHLHSSSIYTVYFMGFLPGFMYLGGLPEKLHQPRKSTPDRKVPEGSVAIGGTQTGIYPMDSPGGWHVIGNCPLSFFNPDHDPPCFINPGDVIQFESIDPIAYEAIKDKVLSRNFVPESIVINGKTDL